MKHYFSKGELALWGASVLGIVVAFCVFDRENYLVLILLWVLASVQDVRYALLRFGQRYLRLHQLAKNEAPPGKGAMKRKMQNDKRKMA